MSLEKALEIQREVGEDSVIPIIFKAINYQSMFQLCYSRGLDCVRAEYQNGRREYENKTT